LKWAVVKIAKAITNGFAKGTWNVKTRPRASFVMTFMDEKELENKVWWLSIHEDLRELLLESMLLVRRVEEWDEKFHDYAFVVFPAAKAYEGFLKGLFFDLKFISDNDYYGKHFRVGKALNPALDPVIREKEGVYDKVVKYCGGKDVADNLWQTWKSCRNLLFHWFPHEKNAIDFNEAKNRVEDVMNSIDLAYTGCNLAEKKLITHSKRVFWHKK